MDDGLPSYDLLFDTRISSPLLFFVCPTPLKEEEGRGGRATERHENAREHAIKLAIQTGEALTKSTVHWILTAPVSTDGLLIGVPGWSASDCSGGGERSESVSESTLQFPLPPIKTQAFLVQLLGTHSIIPISSNNTFN